MKIFPTEDIKTSQELRDDPMAIVRQVRRTRRPVVVTAKGKADVVVMDAATYEARLHLANLSTALAVGEADVAAGRLVPAEKAFAELRRG
jgi:prevent-host-death family protein